MEQAPHPSQPDNGVERLNIEADEQVRRSIGETSVRDQCPRCGFDLPPLDQAVTKLSDNRPSATDQETPVHVEPGSRRPLPEMDTAERLVARALERNAARKRSSNRSALAAARG